MKWLLLLPILILSLIGCGFYFVGTMDVVADESVEVVYPECIIDNGLLTRTFYMQYSLLPTENTQSDTVYRVVLDNGYVKQEDKIIWTDVELGINKAKLIKHKISQEEFESLGLYPRYELTVTEVRSERDVNYLMLPVLYIGLLGFVALGVVDYLKGKRLTRSRVVV